MMFKFTDGVIDIDKMVNNLTEESDYDRHSRECDESNIDGTDGTCLVCGERNLL